MWPTLSFPVIGQPVASLVQRRFGVNRHRPQLGSAKNQGANLSRSRPRALRSRNAVDRSTRLERCGGRSQAQSTLILRTLNLRVLPGKRGRRKFHPESADLGVVRLHLACGDTVYMGNQQRPPWRPLQTLPTLNLRSVGMASWPLCEWKWPAWPGLRPQNGSSLCNPHAGKSSLTI